MDYNNCNKMNSLAAYRVVQTIYERNTIPCVERLNGMVVTVVGEDKSYLQYMLKGGDPCVNSNWKPYNFSVEELNEIIGHKTITTEVTAPITSSELNTRFPKAKEGFQVTYTTLNTTFMKIFNDSWLMSNNIQI